MSDQEVNLEPLSVERKSSSLVNLPIALARALNINTDELPGVP